MLIYMSLYPGHGFEAQAPESFQREFTFLHFLQQQNSSETLILMSNAPVQNTETMKHYD